MLSNLLVAPYTVIVGGNTSNKVINNSYKWVYKIIVYIHQYSNNKVISRYIVKGNGETVLCGERSIFRTAEKPLFFGVCTLIKYCNPDYDRSEERRDPD